MSPERGLSCSDLQRFSHFGSETCASKRTFALYMPLTAKALAFLLYIMLFSSQQSTNFWTINRKGFLSGYLSQKASPIWLDLDIDLKERGDA